MKSKVRAAIEKLLKTPDLEASLPEEVVVKSLEDVQALASGFEELTRIDPAESHHRAHALAALLQATNLEDGEARTLMRQEVLPRLLDLDARFAASTDEQAADTRMFLLKQIACFAHEDALCRILEAAHSGYQPEAYLWNIVFAVYTGEHPQHKELFASLANNLPKDFAGVSLLDAANAALIGGAEFDHPFDNPPGVERLRAWLRDLNEEHFSYAHSATAALPFLCEPARSELLELATDHPDQGVSLEAAWASAKIGSKRGVRRLAEFAKNINTAATAIQYLTELGLENAIPEEALDDNFQAKALMVQWLSHPSEFGEPPEEIEVYDTRELFWPPTNDRRQVWLLRYRYPKNEHRDEEDIGLGMLGSVTFALFGEVTKDLKPLDAYALHCCWELEINEDPRAPKKTNRGRWPKTPRRTKRAERLRPFTQTILSGHNHAEPLFRWW